MSLGAREAQWLGPHRLTLRPAKCIQDEEQESNWSKGRARPGRSQAGVASPGKAGPGRVGLIQVRWVPPGLAQV